MINLKDITLELYLDDDFEHRIDAALDAVALGISHHIIQMGTAPINQPYSVMAPAIETLPSGKEREVGTTMYGVVVVRPDVLSEDWPLGVDIVFRGSYDECNKWVVAQNMKTRIKAFLDWRKPGTIDDGDIPF